MEFSPFSRGAIFTAKADPVALDGICVALCDLWLKLMQDVTARSPEDRMHSLRASAARGLRDRKSYLELRAEHSREAERRHRQSGLGHDSVDPTASRGAARRDMGGRLGLRFEEKTRAELGIAGRVGLANRLTEDLELPGSRMTWTLGWATGRPAIAGVHTVAGVSADIHRMSVHLFDANVGEYVGRMSEVAAMVESLFRKAPYCRLVQTVGRTVETAPVETGEDRFRLS